MTFYSCNNAPNITRVNGLIQEAVDIENKLLFLIKNASYLIGGCSSNNNEACQEAVLRNKHPCQNDIPKEDKVQCEENNKIIPLRDIKQEVIEVVDRDYQRTEIINELREKCMDMFNKVAQ